MSSANKIKISIAAAIASSLFSLSLRAAPPAAPPTQTTQQTTEQSSAGDRKVQVKVEEDIRVRSKQGDLLIEEAHLPPGSVIEVSLQEYQNPVDLPYWSGSRDRKAQFVKKIRVVKVPGFSPQDINEINTWLPVEGLYISRKQLGEGIVVADSANKRPQRVTLQRPAYIMRNDGPNPTDIPQPKLKPEPDTDHTLEPRVADALVEQMNQARETVGSTGVPKSYCAECDRHHLFRKFVDQGVPAKALADALKMLEKNPRGAIKNKRYVAIADYTKHSSQKRFFLLDMRTGEVKKTIMSHGRGSESRNGSGFADRFGNRKESKMTPAGFHVTSKIGYGPHVRSRMVVMKGIEPGLNDQSAGRGILLHTTNIRGKRYATYEFLKAHGWLGRSSGCIAVPPEDLEEILGKIEGGALIYNYTGKSRN